MSEPSGDVDPVDGPDPHVADGVQSAAVIVVGLDGSSGSLSALQWAVREARVRGVAVRAVLAWQQPVPYFGGDKGWAVGMDPSIGTMKNLAAAAAAEVERLEAEAGSQGDVAVSYEAVEGHPAEVLIRASKTASCVVVGSRGHGGFVGSLLGSVSQQVVQHAVCPVVVIPEPGRSRITAVPDRFEPSQTHDTFITLTGVSP